MPGVDALPHGAVREALRLLGHAEPPPQRAAARRALREVLSGRDAVRDLLDRAPHGGRAAFMRLACDGPASVSDLLGRGWWGHGALPPPLDWLQRRALVLVGADGLLHTCDEARESLSGHAADGGGEAVDGGQALEVRAAGCVVVAPNPEVLDHALTVATAGLRAVAPTVAVSQRSAQTVAAALRGVGLSLADDALVPARPGAPALPGTSEDAVGPRAVRALLDRALAEGRQVRLQYFASSRGGAATDRVVDPWAFTDDLLRGYCHFRDGERSFAVDRIGRARLLPSSLEVPPGPSRPGAG